MYIFNPEHDLCIANGDIHFVPPESALAFGRDCASIVKFMRGLDIDADNGINKIVPWGWNSVLCDRLVKEGISKELLPSDKQLIDIKNLSQRMVAHEALEYLENKLKVLGEDLNHNIGIRQIPSNYRIAAKSVDQVEQFLAENQNVVLKAPLSGSGKGIRFVSQELSHSDSGWCKKLIAKHGYVVAEKRYQPIMEFAMLFKCAAIAPDVASVSDSAPKVEFVGYSLFYTQNGAYRGNILASDNFIEEQITKYIPLDLLNDTKFRLMEFLKSKLSGKYEGFVGVDQFVCCNFAGSNESGASSANGVLSAGNSSSADVTADRFLVFNPVVEINLRMTMGLIARNIYDRFAAEYNLTDGTQCFEICRDIKEEKMVYSYRIADICNL